MKISHLFLCTLLFICASCGSDDTPEPVPAETIGTVQGTINGMTFNSTLGTSTLTELQDTGQQYNITGLTNVLSLENSGGINLSFTLPLDTALEVDSYSFAGTDCSFFGPITEICAVGGFVMNLNQEGYTSECSACSFNVTVTQVDFQNEGSIEGTFTGMFQDINSSEIFPVTDGLFKVIIAEF